MKKKILITGVAGSGKSTASRLFSDFGYKAYDIEGIEGMFQMYRKDTDEIYADHDNADPKKIKNAKWLCNVEKLRELLEKQKEDITFYCGVASNMDDIIPLFDEIILIQTSSGMLHKRLSNREGTNDMGNTEKSRQAVLGWKDWWEDRIKRKGALVVDASGEPSNVVEKILEIFN